MNEKEYLDLIEKLNKDYIDAINSKEYQSGRKLQDIKNYVKKLQFLKLIKKTLTHKKINKYNCSNSMILKNNIDNSFTTIKKIAIYTCIVGNYDDFKEPLYTNTNCDYYLITDNKNIKTNKMTRIIISDEIKNKFDNNGTLINRYYKLNPSETFNEYDYSIYIDGSIEIISDLVPLINNINQEIGIAIHKHRDRECIFDEYKACKIMKKGNIKQLKKQLDKYSNDGFPKKYGMAECGIIVTNLKNNIALDIEKSWWEEFKNSESLRDQISLPYVLWKKNYKISDITTLGNNIYTNSKVRISNKHSK